MALHHYRGALLQNVWLENGYQHHKTQWGEGTSYCDIEGLFKAITIELCISKHRLTGDAVRFLRRRLELRPDQLGAKLGCTGQDIAQWEKGDGAMMPAPSARLLRRIALAAIAPLITLSDEIVDDDDKTPANRVFSYSDETGWQTTERGTFSGGENSIRVL